MAKIKKKIHHHVNPIKHGRQSKLVQSFLKRHGLDDIELPSTGSLVKDMAFKLALYQEKQEAMNTAIEILRSHDARGLSLYNMLIEINLLLAEHERNAREKEKSLVEDKDYLNWMKTKLDIIKHYEKMQFDLEKIKVEAKVKSIAKHDDDVLFIVE
jgi:hypothetical protein